MELYSLHLFAGAGGGILADAICGHKTIGAVEIEAYPRKVLLARQIDGSLSRFPIWDDVRTFRKDNPLTSNFIERCIKHRESLIISGGFPCQDISVAGKGAGIEGNRSGLWSEFARIICEIRPRFVFVENSPALTSRGLSRVLGDLASMGYDAEWCVLGASDVGAPHRRKRIWILANAKSEQNRRLFKQRIFTNLRAISNDIPNPESSWKSQQEGRKQNKWRRNSIKGVIKECTNKKKWPIKSERPIRSLYYESGWWATERGLVRVANGISNRVHRLKALGNAQVPLCAATAYKILLERLIKS